jgi:uncharacterized delta-60 repeat protein
MKKALLLYVSFQLVFLQMTFSQKPILDPTFGINGIVTTDLFNGLEDPSDLLVQPDDKILVCGAWISGGKRDLMIIRYLPNGELDSSFGNNGYVLQDISLSNKHDKAGGMLLLPSGKIMVTGWLIRGNNRYYEHFMALFQHDGLLDNSFGNSGVAIFGVSDTSLFLPRIQQQSNGKYIVAGNSNELTTADLVVSRINPSGVLDKSFGNDGYVFFDKYQNFDKANDMVVLPDDKILVCGLSYNPSIPAYETIVTRLSKNGKIDSTFGINGFIKQPSTHFGQNNIYYNRIVSYNSKYFLTGGYLYLGLDSRRAVISKYFINGKIDSSFADFGHLKSGFYNKSEVYGMLVQTNGKIIFGMNGHKLNVGKDIGVLRVGANGEKENIYQGGLFIIDISNDDEFADMSFQQGKKVIMMGTKDRGSGNQDIFLLRLSYDKPVGVDKVEKYPSFRIYPNPVENEMIIEFDKTWNANQVDDRIFYIYDIQGVLIDELRINKKIMSFQLDHLVQGFYIAKYGKEIRKFIKL